MNPYDVNRPSPIDEAELTAWTAPPAGRHRAEQVTADTRTDARVPVGRRREGRGQVMSEQSAEKDVIGGDHEPIFIRSRIPRLSHMHSEPICAFSECETYLTRDDMRAMRRTQVVPPESAGGDR